VSPDDAMEVLGPLIAFTPGPWDDAVVEMWGRRLEELPHVHAGEAARVAATKLCDDWGQMFRPTWEAFIARYDEALAGFPVRAIARSNVHCDGTGWIEHADGYRPCPRCNDIIAAVYRDPDKLARWRNGTGLHLLDVGMEMKKGLLKRTDGAEPVTCEPWPEEPAPIDPERFAALREHIANMARHKGATRV
jgi:hypothetical protein